jgi:hypothetical protein
MSILVHRSGRAQLRHPAPQIMGSLSASSAIRCCFGDTLSSSDALGMFPPNGSMIRHSLPSPGSSWFLFPCFNGTVECSDFLPLISPRFVAFAWRYPPRASVFASL